MQADGDILLPNQSVLPLQRFFRYNAVHLLAVPVTAVTTQRQESVAAEFRFIHTPGHKTDLQMRVRVKIVQKFTVLGKKAFLLFLPRQLKIDIRECHCHGEKPRFHLTDAAFVHRSYCRQSAAFSGARRFLMLRALWGGIHFGLFCGSAQLL